MCVLLVTFPIHWAVQLIQLFSKYNDDSGISVNGKNPVAAIPPEILERFGYALFTPLVMIYIAAKIAPKFRFETAIALAVLWGMIFGASMTLAISEGQYSGWGWVPFVISCTLGIAGVSIGLYKVHHAEKEI